MSENNIIKSITAHICPKCKEEIFIESQMTPSVIGSLFTKDDVKKAKEDCLSRIETLSIEDEKKEQVTKWINNEETIFAPSEVESIILSLLKSEK